ncbi:hypothetical protein [Morganella psychrotolerans]|uniref:Uncharacterized protein n=1 Tax=Morganella psychrotolerans TaxID=368603 RepID=A0A1B8HKF3_9GAMM|nr:hypothetical protein [Morganella psychrotolerans]OBU09714.1 hypothetical protein AYY17_18025 [Morganella psychrotolerans]
MVRPIIDVHQNSYDVPVIVVSNPLYTAMIADPVNIYVMVDNDYSGHVGLVIGDREQALLYDPSGGYIGCGEKCLTNEVAHRGSAEFMPYPDFDWDTYLSYHRWSSDDIVVIQFTIPGEHAERLRNIILNNDYSYYFHCATNVARVLRESGGIFENLEDGFRAPWGVKKELLGMKPPAVLFPNAK